MSKNIKINVDEEKIKTMFNSIKQECELVCNNCEKCKISKVPLCEYCFEESCLPKEWDINEIFDYDVDNKQDYTIYIQGLSNIKQICSKIHRIYHNCENCPIEALCYTWYGVNYPNEIDKEVINNRRYWTEYKEEEDDEDDD